jgi:hypothetical protein
MSNLHPHGGGHREMRAMTLSDDMADRIYSALFRHLDDRRFRIAKTRQILDWLTTDDELNGTETTEQLVTTWREYDAEDVAANA